MQLIMLFRDRNYLFFLGIGRVGDKDKPSKK